jgi:hypothetical protein
MVVTGNENERDLLARVQGRPGRRRGLGGIVDDVLDQEYVPERGGHGVRRRPETIR